ncbi:exodeoxyribonuclease VII large subunit [Roseivirga sp.]|uniref:exodeoxyribonuclease VII large subunit n=1 Tax=Roseivirga sp. TaxID=1964215 RepID=UPI003BABFB06
MSLFELTNLIKQTLDTSLAPSYWVIAEISELRLNQKGHCYLELVEKEGNYIQAKLRANIWSYTYRTISEQFLSSTGSELKSGIKVLLNVSVSFHEVYGMSVTVNNVDPNYTIGEKSRLREETIQKLKEADLINKNKLHTLPEVPQKIAVISSETAAGFGDFMNQIKENSKGYHFDATLFHSTMQGNEAVISIRKAFKAIHESDVAFDVVVLIRGGGAKTDLDSFDSFELARAIALFPLPVLSGIGHERDVTVVDFVAHTSLKTPTAVAEFLISGMDRFNDQLLEYAYRVEKVFEQKLNSQQQKLQELTHRIEHVSIQLLKSHQHLLKEKSLALKYKANHFFEKQNVKIDALQKQLELIDPELVLKRGYTLTLKEGKPIESLEIKVGDQIETRTSDSNIKSNVTAIEHE